MLLLSGADASKPKKAGYDTPLMYACRRDNVELVRLMLECGADGTAVDTSGRNAAHWAAESGSLECLKELALHGIDTAATQKGCWSTPAEVAKRNYQVSQNVSR